MHVLAPYAVCIVWYSSFLIILQVGLHMYSCIYALTTYAVTVHVQSVKSRDWSLLTISSLLIVSDLVYAPVRCELCNSMHACNQANMKSHRRHQRHTYVKVRMCVIIHVLMHAVLEQKHIIQGTLMHTRSPCGKVWAPQGTVAMLAR